MSEEREHCDVLAERLRRIADLMRDEVDMAFDMGVWFKVRVKDNPDQPAYYTTDKGPAIPRENICGTVGCIAGFAALDRCGLSGVLDLPDVEDMQRSAKEWLDLSPIGTTNLFNDDMNVMMDKRTAISVVEHLAMEVEEGGESFITSEMVDRAKRYAFKDRLHNHMRRLDEVSGLAFELDEKLVSAEGIFDSLPPRWQDLDDPVATLNAIKSILLSALADSKAIKEQAVEYDERNTEENN